MPEKKDPRQKFLTPPQRRVQEIFDRVQKIEPAQKEERRIQETGVARLDEIQKQRKALFKQQKEIFAQHPKNYFLYLEKVKPLLEQRKLLDKAYNDTLKQMIDDFEVLRSRYPEVYQPNEGMTARLDHTVQKLNEVYNEALRDLGLIEQQIADVQKHYETMDQELYTALEKIWSETKDVRQVEELANELVRRQIITHDHAMMLMAMVQGKDAPEN